MVVGGARGAHDALLHEVGCRRRGREETAENFRAQGVRERRKAGNGVSPRLVCHGVGGALPLVLVAASADLDVAAEGDGAIRDLGTGLKGVKEPESVG